MSVLVFAIASPAFIAPPQPASALSVAVPSNADEMIRKSDFIVIGDVEQSIENAKTRWVRNSRGEVTSAYSEVRVKVRKVFKGNPKVKEILVGQHVVWATNRGGKRYVQLIDEDVKPFKKARYLLFLQKGLGVDTYFPAGIVYGKYNLDGKDPSEEDPHLRWAGFEEIRKVVRQQFKAN
jgi:hypothetical protein